MNEKIKVSIVGLPASGKSTLIKILQQKGFPCVLEVSKLFGSPEGQTDLWYYEKQFERWKAAVKNDSEFIFIENDVFQPIWMNWMFEEEKGWGQTEEIYQFFNEKIVNRDLSFPDFYIYLDLDEHERSEREKSRCKKLGIGEDETESKIKRFRRINSAFKAYFRNLGDKFPGLVFFTNFISLDNFMNELKNHRIVSINSENALNWISDWCKNHKITEFRQHD